MTLTWSSTAAHTFEILVTILEAVCTNPHISSSSLSRILQQKDLDVKTLLNSVVENVQVWIQDSFQARLVGMRAMGEMEMKKISTASVVKEQSGTSSDVHDDFAIRGEVLIFILERICEDWSALLAHFDRLYLG